MRKIPTLFVRDEQDRRYVTDAVTPGCEWVLAGEGVATRKYDGTCVMLDDFGWWARREVRWSGKEPEGFQPVDSDPVTRKTVGWEPIAQSSFAKWHAEALREGAPISGDAWLPGTYELVGAKINGDPERVGAGHYLIRHQDAYRIDLPADPADIRGVIRELHDNLGWEGVVWHHPDGRMAKLKARDLRPTS